MALAYNRQNKLYNPNPEQQEQRKKCIFLLKDYCFELDQALRDLDKVEQGCHSEHEIKQAEMAIYRNLCSAIEKYIDDGEWQVSRFFETVRAGMQAVHSRIMSDVFEKQAEENPLEPEAVESKQVNVYIVLYQADSENIAKWAQQLVGITALSVSRPIYQEESAAITAIRTQTEKNCSGYVSVTINRSDIIEPMGGKRVADRYGRELLTVRSGAISKQNIVEFVRIVRNDKRYYTLQDNKLIPTPLSNTE